jgi:c-di-GMP-binding flagellar brake protein YcgR
MSNKNGHVFVERRRYVRLRRRFVVRIAPDAGAETGPGGAPSKPESASSPAGVGTSGKDISLGGIAIESPSEYPEGMTLALTVFLPALGKYLTFGPGEKSGLFRVQCEVIWSKRSPEGKYTTGLRFVKLSEHQFKALSQLIAQEVAA